MIDKISVGDVINVNVGSIVKGKVLEKMPRINRIACELVHPDHGETMVGEFSWQYEQWSLMHYRNSKARSIVLPVKEKSKKGRS